MGCTTIYYSLYLKSLLTLSGLKVDLPPSSPTSFLLKVVDPDLLLGEPLSLDSVGLHCRRVVWCGWGVRSVGAVHQGRVAATTAWGNLDESYPIIKVTGCLSCM